MLTNGESAENGEYHGTHGEHGQHMNMMSTMRDMIIIKDEHKFFLVCTNIIKTVMKMTELMKLMQIKNKSNDARMLT